jgi:DNA modification methylase
MSVITGDCLAAMAAMEPDSIDAIVTDPPYGLEFMGKAWDDLSGVAKANRGTLTNMVTDRGTPKFRTKAPAFDLTPSRQRDMQEWHEAWAREALRVAKPGAHLIAFGGTRTVHRMTCAIENAGWEIRDMLVWGYASGFPKSHDVSKAIDKTLGAKREVVGSQVMPGYGKANADNGQQQRLTTEFPKTSDSPATDEATAWQGWGTALKPAWEPIIMARKPLRETVAANVLEYGTGALNIDGCRIETSDPLGGGAEKAMQSEKPEGWDRPWRHDPEAAAAHGARISANVQKAEALGRWPANVILTDPIFDGDMEGVEGAGAATTGGSIKTARQGFAQDSYMGGGAGTGGYESYGDAGTYSRFFIIPKAARSEREPAGGGFPKKIVTVWGGDEDDLTPGKKSTVARFNTHPTVKPVGLMRHLVRLITPRGGVVLDPFLGSGTTAVAAIEEGFDWMGIEKEAEYVAIAEARIAAAQAVKEAGMGLWDL